MAQPPENIAENSLKEARHIIFDGTYFHKDGCLVVIIDAISKIMLAYWYIDKESYHSVLPMLGHLRQAGLNPRSVTIDGHRMVMRAFKDVWPKVLIQRCLYHIKYQGVQWLRLYPKTEAGKSLKKLISTITAIYTEKDRDLFITSYDEWLLTNKKQIKVLPKTSVANTDLKRTMALITNAIPNMFHFVDDKNIPSSTNMLEGLFSQIKHQYMRHRGLSNKNKVSYLLWFCYFTNQNSNKK